ncbi:penicillin acylase family protein [uncultured Alteromonas sp.]|uniref:penicillin acylase family protein n=1 Tax=uncultured Alteromonas sp. TaxID=179113 RepID=UPI0025FB7BA6|nr:penicillin acylase family protein [uncultured Alteromonas sp.]
MLNWLKRIGLAVIGLLIIAVMAVYFTLRQSLPALDGDRLVNQVEQPATLSRDALGQAIIQTASRKEAMYLLGFAHGQDRFFQMDLQRRVAGGELSEWLGKMALDVDKTGRFHEFRRRAENIFATLPEAQKDILVAYSEGVNQAIAEQSARPFEYILTNFEQAPWTPQDSILVIFSMYLDLQSNNVNRDLTLSEIQHQYGQTMVDFIVQPSQYQAALDNSRLATEVEIPLLKERPAEISDITADMAFRTETGSNNWIVGGALTETGDALLASDMHLSMRVPIIWYRAQLNYTEQQYDVSLTGVTLPGVPGVIAGTNGHIAWGFTNAYVDTADWVLIDRSEVTAVDETISVKGEPEHYKRLTSQYGPVRQLGTRFYALKWAAQEPYAVNLMLNELDTKLSVLEAIPVVRKIGIPVQNIALGDAAGNIAWMPAGAVPGRKVPHNTAITPAQLDGLWSSDEMDLPVVMNPTSHRIWTANARVMGSDDYLRFGDGGYALGARAQQIRDRLFDYQQFDEARFYQIQLDNEARFLQPWHALLRQLLKRNSGHFAADINALDTWQNCACADSVGYTLVKYFRRQVLNATFAPINEALKPKHLSLRSLSSNLEPAIWQLIRSESTQWLPQGENDWQGYLLGQYEQARQHLLDQHSASDDLSTLAWGKVNQQAIRHPFAGQIPVIGKALNMPEIPGYGDTFMPAVQGRSFGASQRLFVRPGQLDKAVLTLPGGQSGHPLSAFYKAGFDDYAKHRMTPLLPGKPLHTLTFMPE